MHRVQNLMSVEKQDMPVRMSAGKRIGKVKQGPDCRGSCSAKEFGPAFYVSGGERGRLYGK